MAKVLVSSFQVSEFKLQPHYYIHFWTYILANDMNFFIHSATLLFFYNVGFDIKKPLKVDKPLI